MYINILCKFGKGKLQNKGSMVFTRLKMEFFEVQGQITLDPINRFCPLSKGTEVLWIQRHHVSLVKIGQRMKSLWCSQGKSLRRTDGRTTDNTPSHKLFWPTASRAKNQICYYHLSGCQYSSVSPKQIPS